MVIAISWFMCGLIAMAIGQRKGEAFSGLIAGWIFGPLGILLAMLGSGNRMPCPFCKEKINKQALVCPHCREKLNPEPLKKSLFDRIAVAIGAFLFVFLVLLLCFAEFGGAWVK